MRTPDHPILGEAKLPDTYILYQGEKIPAISGETVAATLYAAGIRGLRTTVKGHKRGIFCGIGRCNDCKMIVNGVSNTKTCVTLVAPGMTVMPQVGLGKDGEQP